MLKNKVTSENATRVDTQNKTTVESPSFDLTGLLTVLALVGIIGFVVLSAIDNGRSSKNQDHQLIKELIKHR
jgi:hypothetical protein